MKPALPGGVPPDKRLGVHMERLRTGTSGARSAVRRNLRRRPTAFPLAAPTWPSSVPRPPLERGLGVDYDTDWARRYPARVARLFWGEGVTRPLIHALARPRVFGGDHLASLDGPAVFAANHASHLDAPLVLAVLPEPWRHRIVVGGAADYFFDTKVKSAVFALTMNTIPIERQKVSRASATRAVHLLEEGWSMLIFPEGGRTPDGWAHEHRPGAAWLAVRAGRPIVPVHIEGTRAILPRHANRLKPGVTHVSFGRPIRTSPDSDPRRLATEVEAAINTLADERQSDWWSATRRAAAGDSPTRTGPDGTGAWRRTWALGEPKGARRPAARRWPNL